MRAIKFIFCNIYMKRILMFTTMILSLTWATTALAQSIPTSPDDTLLNAAITLFGESTFSKVLAGVIIVIYSIKQFSNMFKAASQFRLPTLNISVRLPEDIKISVPDKKWDGAERRKVNENDDR